MKSFRRVHWLIDELFNWRKFFYEKISVTRNDFLLKNSMNLEALLVIYTVVALHQDFLKGIFIKFQGVSLIRRIFNKNALAVV